MWLQVGLTEEFMLMRRGHDLGDNTLSQLREEKLKSRNFDLLHDMRKNKCKK